MLMFFAAASHPAVDRVPAAPFQSAAQRPMLLAVEAGPPAVYTPSALAAASAELTLGRPASQGRVAEGAGDTVVSGV
ncbi:MAG: hypothetical protein ABSC16_14735 [Candidatus Dormibacteria bacterium]